ncbi:Transient-receptor-potential-like protein [Armadillidium vulgare]|nr:Transient-receptor-potential-like protein [Armadillidium vulgare]
MSYFDPGSTLPAPFNLIISPKSVAYFLRGCKNIVVFLCRFAIRKRRKSRRTFGTDKGVLHGPNASNKCRQSRRYAEVMRRLVSRYIHQAKKQHRQDGVNEDDLLEIKQDISSLRYELREDRKREAARAYGQMDSIKKDILRLLRQKTINGGAPPPTTSNENSENPANYSTEVLNPGETYVEAPVCPSCSHSPIILPNTGGECVDGKCGEDDPEYEPLKSPFRNRNARGKMKAQQSVDLGMLERVPQSSPAIDITVTPASSLPNTLTYSQGNLSGCLLAPQEMDYLRKEIVRSIRTELKDLLKDALGNALSPTAQNPSPQLYSPTTTPTPSPRTSATPTAPFFSSPEKSRHTTFSRAPTLEAPSSPLLSPTSATLRVPYMSVGPHTTGTQKNSLSGGGNANLSTSSPVLLCPINESEKVFKQMYTQI